MSPTEPRLDVVLEQLGEMSRELRDLQGRVARLEAQGIATESSTARIAPGASTSESTPWQPEPPAPVAPGDSSGSGAVDARDETPTDPWSADYLEPAAVFRFVTLLGRTLVVLGGGYLLRALTDAGLLPPYGGIVAGLLYASVWLLLATLTSTADKRQSAAFHGLAASMIAYPLIAEATLRFRILGSGASSLLLAAFCVLGLAIARRRDVAAVAWTGVVFAVVTSFALSIGTRDLLPPALALLVVVAATEWLIPRDRWKLLRWVPAIALDAHLLLVASIAGRPGGLPEGYAPVAAPLLLAAAVASCVVLLSAVAFRTLRKSAQVTAFDVAQLAAAVAILVFTAARLEAAADASLVATGAISILAGMLCYAVAFGFIERQPGREFNFYYFGAAGGALALAGAWILLQGDTLAAVCLLLALAVTAMGGRWGRASLCLHGAVFLTVGALVSGLPGYGADGLFGRATRAWASPSLLCHAAGVGAIACYAILAATRRQREPLWYERIPEAVVACWAGWSIASTTTRWLVGAIAAAPGPDADAGLVAALRTAVLAVLAVVLASAAKRLLRRELSWVVYVVLAAGALKLLAEDLPVGRPATLFVALALYGGALFSAPRLMRAEPKRRS